MSATDVGVAVGAVVAAAGCGYLKLVSEEPWPLASVPWNVAMAVYSPGTFGAGVLEAVVAVHVACDCG